MKASKQRTKTELKTSSNKNHLFILLLLQNKNLGNFDCTLLVYSLLNQSRITSISQRIE